MDFVFQQLNIRKRSFIPSPLLKLISHYSSVFEEHEQHDAQELLMWLLDNIHEDVNRRRIKESVELPDFDEDTDDYYGANIYWEAHKKRNDSIIVDTLHGQYKAEMVCSVCKKSKKKFDPFMCLTIELPTADLSVDCIIVKSDLSKHQVTFI
jgi:ubiquitin carboxyl-terminal hydrolase 4/11/15